MITKNGATFDVYEDLTQIKDAMQLDSNTEICAYYSADNKFAVTIEVRGEVDVDFNGKNYRQASDMPKELLELLGDPNNWYSGDADEGLYVSNNNWFEIFVWYVTEDGEIGEWTGSSDVIECGGETNDELLYDCEDYLATFRKSTGE